MAFKAKGCSVHVLEKRVWIFGYSCTWNNTSIVRHSSPVASSLYRFRFSHTCFFDVLPVTSQMWSFLDTRVHSCRTSYSFDFGFQAKTRRVKQGDETQNTLPDLSPEPPCRYDDIWAVSICPWQNRYGGNEEIGKSTTWGKTQQVNQLQWRFPYFCEHSTPPKKELFNGWYSLCAQKMKIIYLHCSRGQTRIVYTPASTFCIVDTKEKNKNLNIQGRAHT